MNAFAALIVGTYVLIGCGLIASAIRAINKI